jgi:hypothetical protein
MITNFDNMIGRVMVSVKNLSDDRLVFVSDGGINFTFYHQGDCCESVYIEDVCGDLNDLVGSPILVAEEVSSSDIGFDESKTPCGGTEASFTWTFYRFATIKGSVTVRWFGTSNGYYSEGVSYIEI